MEIKTNATDRKALVKSIASFMDKEIHYAGPPTFAYTVGNCTIDRACTVICESEDEGNALAGHLAEAGFIEQPVDNLCISVPTDTENVNTLRNLIFMLHSHQYLLNRVTGKETFVISDSLVKALEDTPTDEGGTFSSILSSDTGEWKGITINQDNVEFTFPLSEDTNKNRAYAELAAFMVARAKEAVRVSPTELKPENEKYYFRSWLLRLGFTGDGGKESRKALLTGLKGHTAFRTPTDAEKHKARLAARKAAQAQASEDSGEE